ncbi:hypothetical protein LSAT2_007330 [Lamellibrachia satsuma]|nr:hypothetical protein LSAT2_007330 [Lamellibrachia satsuma]
MTISLSCRSVYCQDFHAGQCTIRSFLQVSVPSGHSCRSVYRHVFLAGQCTIRSFLQGCVPSGHSYRSVYHQVILTGLCTIRSFLQVSVQSGCFANVSCTMSKVGDFQQPLQEARIQTL